MQSQSQYAGDDKLPDPAPQPAARDAPFSSPVPADPPAVSPADTPATADHARIAVEAYRIAEERGFPENADLEHWLEAEKRITQHGSSSERF